MASLRGVPRRCSDLLETDVGHEFSARDDLCSGSGVRIGVGKGASVLVGQSLQDLVDLAFDRDQGFSHLSERLCLCGRGGCLEQQRAYRDMYRRCA